VDTPSDSDVSLEKDEADVPLGASKPKSPSDSDIRLEDLPSARGREGSDGAIVTEEIDLDAEERKARQKAPAPRPKTKKKSKLDPSVSLPTSSPFEISEDDLDLDPTPPPPTKQKKSGIDSSSDFELIPFDENKAPVELGSGEIPLLSDDDEVDLGTLAGGKGASGINLDKPADSGIPLEPGGSDELEFDMPLEVAGGTPRPAPGADSSDDGAATDADSSSEFELSIDDSDASPTESSDSEFELTLDDEGAPAEDGSDSEFELTLDADSSGPELAVEDSDTGSDSGSDSEFELTLDADSESEVVTEEGEEKDIFEETNFEVPALEDESESEAVALEEGDTDLEASDFELDLEASDSGEGDESGSGVVALDDDEEVDDGAATVARPAAKPRPKTKAKPQKAADRDESSEGLDVGLDEDEPVGEEEDERATAPAVVEAGAAPWGPLPAILLMPTVIVLFVVGLMGFELVRGMWGYHQPGISRPVIDGIAGMFTELPKDK